MNINIKTFITPFSFFCTLKDESEDVNIPKSFESGGNCAKFEVSDAMHGRYVAVFWNNQWVRGVVSTEKMFTIWLIDHGVFLRPDDKTVYIDLPGEYKKYPTKVFEASIHGVNPTDKVLTEECEIKNIISTKWNCGATERAQNLITNARNVFFVPVAMLCTKKNDIILGDLYIQMPDHSIVNIVDELLMWPVFLEKNREIYFKNLSTYYKSSRLHHACLLKPSIAEQEYALPIIDVTTTLIAYNIICENVPAFGCDVYYGADTAAGNVGVPKNKRNKSKEDYQLTETEIEKYSKMYWHINGEECNVLHILLNKIKDLKTCERYQDYDLKSMGRATHRIKFNEIYYNHTT